MVLGSTGTTSANAYTCEWEILRCVLLTLVGSEQERLELCVAALPVIYQSVRIDLC